MPFELRTKMSDLYNGLFESDFTILLQMVSKLNASIETDEDKEGGK